MALFLVDGQRFSLEGLRVLSEQPFSRRHKKLLQSRETYSKSLYDRLASSDCKVCPFLLLIY